MDLAQVKETFGLFVSAVEGHHCSRFGTQMVIGGKRKPTPPGTVKDHKGNLVRDELRDRGAGQLVISCDKIVALPVAEAEKYSREYAKAIANGALKERTAEEFHAQLAQVLAAEEKARQEAEAKAKVAAPATEPTVEVKAGRKATNPEK